MGQKMSDVKLSQDDFGFPEAVTATIISFTAHPDEPEFEMLRNLTEPVRKAVDRFPNLLSSDRLLLVESPDSSLNGAWYFENQTMEDPNIPASFNIPGLDEMVKQSMGTVKIYRFTRENSTMNVELMYFNALRGATPVQVQRFRNNSAYTAGKSMVLKLSRNGEEPVEIGGL